MSSEIEIQGRCAPAFSAVGEAFAANFTEVKEVGASFVLESRVYFKQG